MKNLSEKFRKEHIPKFKPGKKYVFRLVNLKVDRFSHKLIVPSYKNTPNTDVIIDPYANNEGGEPVAIEYVQKIVNTAPDAIKDTQKILGNIVFKRATYGEIILNGSKKADKPLFEFLYLSNRNKSNMNKPYHVQPKNYMYELLDADTRAYDENQFEKQKHTATGIIFKLSESKLRIICEQLAKAGESGFKYSPTYSKDVLEKQLIAYGKKQPKNIIVLDDDYNLAVRETVKDAVDSEIITINLSTRQILWTNGGVVICVIPPGMSPEEVLVTFFLTTDGGQVLEMLMTQLEAGGNATEGNTGIIEEGKEELEEARNEYEALAKKKPHPAMKLETLRKKIEEFAVAQ